MKAMLKWLDLSYFHIKRPSLYIIYYKLEAKIFTHISVLRAVGIPVTMAVSCIFTVAMLEPTNDIPTDYV